MAAAISLVLKENQLPHVEHLLEIYKLAPQALDTSATGSGKTYTTLELSRRLALPIFVVCPLAMIKKWTQLANQFGIEILCIMTYQKLAGRKGVYSHDYLVSAGEEECFATPTFVELTKKRPFLLVVDEVQYGKNNTSQRSHAVWALSRAIIQHPSETKLILLSATPFDKSSNADSMLKLLGLLLEKGYYYDRSAREFELAGAKVLWQICTVCDPEYTKHYEYPSSVKSYDEFCYQMFTKIIVPHLSSRMPPPVLDFPHDIANGFFIFNEEENGIIGEAKIALKRAIKGDEENPDGFKDFSNFVKVMQILEYGKRGGMARQAKKVLEKDPNAKVILAAHYVDTLLYLQKEMKDYGCGLLYGDVKIDERERIIELFQQPTNTLRVLVVNPSVCGIGVDLDDNDGRFQRHLFIIPTYELIKVAQMVGRVYRASTKSIPHTRVVYAKIFEEENHILEVLFKKSKIVKGVTQSDEMGLFPGEYPKFVEDE